MPHSVISTQNAIIASRATIARRRSPPGFSGVRRANSSCATIISTVAASLLKMLSAGTVPTMMLGNSIVLSAPTTWSPLAGSPASLIG